MKVLVDITVPARLENLEGLLKSATRSALQWGLIKKMTDEMRYTREDGQNILSLIIRKERTSREAS